MGHGRNALLIQRLVGITVGGKVPKRFLRVLGRLILVLFDKDRRRWSSSQRSHGTKVGNRGGHRRWVIVGTLIVTQIQTAGRSGNGSSVPIPRIDVQLMAQGTQFLLQTGGT